MNKNRPGLPEIESYDREAVVVGVVAFFGG